MKKMFHFVEENMTFTPAHIGGGRGSFFPIFLYKKNKNEKNDQFLQNRYFTKNLCIEL